MTQANPSRGTAPLRSPTGSDHPNGPGFNHWPSFKALAATVSPAELSERVTRELCRQWPADQVFLLLADSCGTLHIRAEHSRRGAPRRDVVPGSICDLAMAGNAFVVPEALSHPLFQNRERVIELNLRSLMACPLGSDQPQGVLYVCSYSRRGLFTEADLDLLRAYAAQVSLHLERMRALAEKERLRRELQTVAGSRGRVAAVAQHELINPVQEIWLALSLVQKQAGLLAERLGPAATPELHETVEGLLAGLGHIAHGAQGVKERYIDPLRRFHQLELRLDRLEPALLTAAALQKMSLAWRWLAPDHRLELFESLPVPLKVDLDLFEQAVAHLIQNAANYSKVGSPIRVTAWLEQAELIIAVEDEGIGIPAEDLPFIGLWLYRGRNVANKARFPAGLGLGLHAARHIVEAHGGQLRIESKLGRGTQVRLCLPLFGDRVKSSDVLKMVNSDEVRAVLGGC